MSLALVVTGFGPFPGAPFNPTGPLVEEIVRRPHPAFARVRRVAHVFPTSYAAVDRDLRSLLEQKQPDVMVMFGLATRSRCLRIETRACNAISRVAADITGYVPPVSRVTHDGPETLDLNTPVARLLMAARSAGVPAMASQNPGTYLCNYLCWRAAEAARQGAPRLIAFIHVPRVHCLSRNSSAMDDLVRAGEAVVLAALSAARLKC
jgi:pyroglutamyl-peptidase